MKEKNPKYLKKQPRTPFFGFPVNYTCPDGFLVPLLWGLRALIKNDRGTLAWRVDPSLFLKQNLNEIAKSYKFALEMATFDPQKVGKNISAYDFAEAAVKAQLAKGQLAA